MNEKKAKKLRRDVGFDPHAKRTYTNEEKTVIATGPRRKYQQEKRNAKS